jgi:DNA-binding transcriptional MerR regulator
MSSRSYLSIGDVLTLLRQEFPDITISKIRFLESQGLVNPERTPSGYRKFYEHDVERLRWVLRQQREHFLPLKVIKDRLDDDGGETSSGSPEVTEVPPMEEPVLVGQRTSNEAVEAHATAGTRHRRADEAPAAVHAGGPTLPGIESGTAGTNGAPPGEGAGAPRAATPDLAPSRTPAARRPSPQAPSAGTGPVDEPPPARSPKAGGAAHGNPATTGSPDGEPGPAPRRPRSNPAAVAAAAQDVSGAEVGTDATPDSPAGPSAAGVAPVAGETRPGPPTATAGRHKGSRATAPPEEPGAGAPVPAGASMSMDELSAASGLEVSTLEELAGFGLLVGTKVAGQLYFDDEGLAVANLAAGFARFGVEPRHLRLYKNAADREAGFVEQIVTPLVRQRNPEARARAHETVDELASLGQQLRASLLRSALGTLLDR